ncbi:hypothetical protein [Pseudonocardia sp.]|uniref:hypothetical protein n=1 Tax=Pseudonocardia sp. TaxID=60912 RepID=UPI002606CDDF|nr:hypothetical protein [Pseudonocardia sp.]MCW2721361.1 hypothetical protein [Pseudonocardia sp.]
MNQRDEALVKAYEQGIVAGRQAAAHEAIGLLRGPDALAREDAARDVARAWAGPIDAAVRGAVVRGAPELAEGLDRLAHGLDNPRIRR